MTEVAGRRADQLRNLVAVLKLAAIDLRQTAPVSEQRLGRCLDRPGLAAARGTEEEKVCDGSTLREHPSAIRFVRVDDRIDAGFLPDNEREQIAAQFFRE